MEEGNWNKASELLVASKLWSSSCGCFLQSWSEHSSSQKFDSPLLLLRPVLGFNCSFTHASGLRNFTAEQFGFGASEFLLDCSWNYIYAPAVYIFAWVFIKLASSRRQKSRSLFKVWDKRDLACLHHLLKEILLKSRPRPIPTYFTTRSHTSYDIFKKLAEVFQGKRKRCQI